MSELTIDMLKDAAENLNELFDPPIQTEDVNLLKKDLIEVGVGLLDSDKDELSKITQKVLVDLGVKLPWDSEEVVMKIEPIEPIEEPIKTKEIEPIEEVIKTITKTVIEAEIETKIKEAKNVKKDIDDTIVDNGNSDNINTNDNGGDIDNNINSIINNNMDKKQNDEIKNVKKISRISFYHQSIKELCKTGATRQEIMKRSDELYKENGGIAKFKATNIASISLGTLIEFDIIIEDQNKKLILV